MLTYNQTRTAIADGHQRARDDCPRGKRWDEWTIAERHAEDRRIVFDGMHYALTTLRLSQAAEWMLACADLDALAERIIADIYADSRACMAIGFVGDFLNRYAREAHAAVRALSLGGMTR